MSGGRLRRVGSLWKPKPGGKSLGNGSLTINGLRQRFVILRNDKKTSEAQPDYVLMAGDEPEVDQYARDHAGTSAQSEQKSAPAFEATAEDVPF